MKKGMWYTDEVGALKMIACGTAFYKSCVERLHLDYKGSLDYQAWMASPYLSQILNSNPDINFSRIQPKEILCFDSNMLKEYDFFVQKIAESGISEGFSNQRVFHEINKYHRCMEIYSDAVKYIELWPEWMRILFSSLIKKIIPVCDKQGVERGISFTDPNLIGNIYSSIKYQAPFPVLRLNIDLAHELAHQSLMIYQHAGDILLGSKEWVYSGVREVERPAISSFHACGALVYMSKCVKHLMLGIEDIAQKAYLSALLLDFNKNLVKGIKAIEHLPMSDLGKNIFNDIRNAVDSSSE